MEESPTHLVKALVSLFEFSKSYLNDLNKVNPLFPLNSLKNKTLTRILMIQKNRITQWSVLKSYKKKLRKETGVPNSQLFIWFR